MTAPHHNVTRRVTLTRKTFRRLSRLPEGLTYLALPGRSPIGEFPHGAASDTCPAALDLTVAGVAGPADDLWCTRSENHDGQHIAHIGHGRPVAAWTDDPNLTRETP